MTKAGIRYGSLWSEDFTDEFFKNGLHQWLKNGAVVHDQSHVRDFDQSNCPPRTKKSDAAWADNYAGKKPLLGVFDEGCMGMFNAIIPDELLHPTSIFKEACSANPRFMPPCGRSAMPRRVRCWRGISRRA